MDLQPSGKPSPTPQVAVPWAVCSHAIKARGQPGQRAILPPGKPEAHIPRWPESTYCEGTAPPLEPQPQPHSLPSLTSLLDELMEASVVLVSLGLSLGTAANQCVYPALQGAPNFLDELMAATSVLASLRPFPGATADQGVDPALPGAPSLLDELLMAMGIPASLGPSWGPLPTKVWTLPSQAHPAS